MLCEMDLAGFGDRRFFKVLSSLKLSVITKILESIDGEIDPLTLTWLTGPFQLPDQSAWFKNKHVTKGGPERSSFC